MFAGAAAGQRHRPAPPSGGGDLGRGGPLCRAGGQEAAGRPGRVSGGGSRPNTSANDSSFSSKPPKERCISSFGREVSKMAQVFQLCRSLTLLAAKGAKKQAIDTVFTNLKDLQGLRPEVAGV